MIKHRSGGQKNKRLGLKEWEKIWYFLSETCLFPIFLQFSLILLRLNKTCDTSSRNLKHNYLFTRNVAEQRNVTKQNILNTTQHPDNFIMLTRTSCGWSCYLCAIHHFRSREILQFSALSSMEFLFPIKNEKIPEAHVLGSQGRVFCFTFLTTLNANSPHREGTIEPLATSMKLSSSILCNLISSWFQVFTRGIV